MNIGENIRNSIQVLYKTYENISKLMEHCKTVAVESGYVLASNKFLRWKSDSNSDGWLLNSFILLFQKRSDKECNSGNNWRDGAVYVVEICLGIKSEPSLLPELLVSKFEYDDINDWSEGCSPAEHWGFHQPIHKEYSESFSCEHKNNVSFYTPKTKKVAEAYWGLRKVTSTSFPLTEVTSGNLKDTVFGTFNVL